MTSRAGVAKLTPELNEGVHKQAKKYLCRQHNQKVRDKNLITFKKSFT
jgi:hypothetical protein